MKKFLMVNLMLFLSAIILVVYYFSVYSDISDNVIRLHIIANSDSDYDQGVKMSVRDEIIKRMQTELEKDSDREDIIASVGEIEKTANTYLKKLGADYGARAEFENVKIPRKVYNGIVMPEGKYSAIRVKLGVGKGENWWCVCYPPLCFTEDVFGKMSDEGEAKLKSEIGKNGYRVIGSDVKYELFLVEFAEKVMRYIVK